MGLYHWLLARVGLRQTITQLLRRWQHGEPLVWLLCTAGLGGVLGRRGDVDDLLWAGSGLLVGILLGHLFWGNNYHNGGKPNGQS